LDVISVSQSTGTALTALSFMGDRGGQWIQAQEIARCTGTPLPYLLKILNRLAEGELIQSKRGYRGGFYLSRAATEITLLEILEAMEGPDWFNDCMLGTKHCPCVRPCPLHAFWSQEKERIREQWKKTKLADLGLEELRRRPPETEICSVQVEQEASNSISESGVTEP
jgi:Rrf2 family protein